MQPEKLARISQLTAIARQRALTEAEQRERQALRQEYLQAIRQDLTRTLENARWVDDEGHTYPLPRKDVQEKKQ